MKKHHPGRDPGSFNLESYGTITGLNIKNSTIQWITPGDGSFFPSTESLNPIYEPGPIDIQNGVTLTVRAYGENSCNTNFDEKNIEVSFTPSPIVKYIIDGQDVSVIEVCEVTMITSRLAAPLLQMSMVSWTTSEQEALIVQR